MKNTITDSVKYIGVDDPELDLFESTYVVPEGVSYNSYVILDEKIAVMDTVDKRKMKEWEKKLIAVLDGRKPDYLILHHLEPDHTGSIKRFLELFPDTIIVGNEKTFLFLPQFFDFNFDEQKLVVEEGDILSLGAHTLCFVMAHMVHWPEVMMSYDEKDKILFSADAFGKFGALSLTEGEEWACEARRYYFNIVGKYGLPVQTVLKKISDLNMQCICPLHGPILNENLEYYLGLYDTWSSYRPEDKGVLIAYASIHGNTAAAAEKLAQLLREKGVEKVVCSDLARVDMAEVIEDAFRYDRMVVMSATYENGAFPCMLHFLQHLQSKAYQKRKVGILENGTWAPASGRVMRSILETMKEVEIVEPMVTIRSTLKPEDMDKLIELAEAVV